MKIFNQFFLWPTITTIILFAAIYFFGGISFLYAVAILTALEITLSFDNAIVNAKVLEKMSKKWQHRFITWGMWLAVLGTRVVLPVLIVSLVSGLNIFEVVKIAALNPGEYAEKLEQAHYSIGAFGGTFLLLVSLKYFFDRSKEIHWIEILEKKLKKFASIDSIEVTLTLLLLVVLSKLVGGHALEVLVSGVIGVASFLLIEGFLSFMEMEFQDMASSGFGLFIYLNILDSAFSLDGVVGAFAISKNLFVIATGLGLGAYFVRSFTLLMVKQKTLTDLKYLEHGAHYAIFALSICMFLGLLIPVPEWLTGSIGLVLILGSYFSSKNA
jgi:hypothetical protein